MDGANMNAQVGLCRPGDIGADVCHLNLHKTFCIPHGGGGPGMGPIARGEAPGAVPAESSARRPRPRPAARHRVGGTVGQPEHPADLLGLHPADGRGGLTMATKIAILSANYIAKRLEGVYPLLYSGANGLDGARVHSRHPDLQEERRRRGRGHRQAADRFRVPPADALVPGAGDADGRADRVRSRRWNSIASSMPCWRSGKRFARSRWARRRARATSCAGTAHPGEVVVDDWDRPYSRERAAFPVPGLRAHKSWPTVGRVDNPYGDRNLVCVCPPVEAYE